MIKQKNDLFIEKLRKSSRGLHECVEHRQELRESVDETRQSLREPWTIARGVRGLDVVVHLAKILFHVHDGCRQDGQEDRRAHVGREVQSKSKTNERTNG